MLRQLRTATVVALVGTAVLSGCSERQEASTTLPSTEPATTSAEALPPLGPVEFPVPAEARTKDTAGAEAFLRYWIDLIDRQRAIPAGQPLRDLGPECVDCHRIARLYDEAAAAGNRYVGGEFTLNDAAEPKFLAEDRATIAFGLRQEAVQRVDGSGSPLDAGQELAPNLSSGITLQWSKRDQGWLVFSMTIG